MYLDEIIKHLKDLEKIPRKRIIKEIQQIDVNILNKISDVIVNDSKQSLSLIFDTTPYRLKLNIPRYYPFKPITCDIMFKPHNTNRIIGNILSKKLPVDLVGYKKNFNLGIWKFYNNEKSMDGKLFLVKNYKDTPEILTEKIIEYNKIYSDWYLGKLILESFNKYLVCFSPFIKL